MILWIWAVLISVLIGLAAKFGFDYLAIRNDVTSADSESTFQISWIEFAIVVAVSAILVIPVTVSVGTKMARDSKTTYHEFWSGYETAANKTSNTCHRDGSCRDTYKCDRYTTTETYTTTDSKGRVSFHTRIVVHYHSCPVATRENYYTINTTLGSYDLGYTFDQNAVPYRSSHGLDGTYQGDPPFWLAAKQRLDAGTPGPVTAERTYPNYILASTRTILKHYNDAVQKYAKAGLLRTPEVNTKHPIHDYYYADKMQFVNVPANAADWNFALSRLNAAFGADLKGDLHVVAVNVDDVTKAEGERGVTGSSALYQYTQALSAYWQNPKLGRRTLSKNGVGLVLGVRDGKIAYANAFTGMPTGNSGLVYDLESNLRDKPFTPAIFGNPVGHVDGKKTTVTLSGSPVENALWGEHKFDRQHMASFKYLKSEIQPSSGQKWAIIIVSVIFVCLLWAIALFTCIGEHHEGSGRGYLGMGRSARR